MQPPPFYPTFLVFLLLFVFFLATFFMGLFIYLTRNSGGEIRRAGVYNSFNNDDEGEQNASRMDITAPAIDTAFNNGRMGQQNLQDIKTTSGESSQAANSGVYRLINILLQFIAYLFGGGKYSTNSKRKQI